MPTVTKIERQKHNNERVSVFIDGEYSFSVSDEIIIQYGIAVGMNVNSLPLKEITEEDEYKRALSSAFKHMSVSEKTEKQIVTHLLRKEFSQAVTQRVITRLKELNYIDDLTFAKNFVEHTSGKGKRAVIFKLREKGVPDSIINEVIANMSEDSQLESAIELLKKQLPKLSKYEGYEKKRRLNDFLLRRGFDWSVAAEAIEKCLEE